MTEFKIEFKKETVVIPAITREILVCPDCGEPDVEKEKHERYHIYHKIKKDKADAFVIGKYVKGVWWEHTHDANIEEPFSGIVCDKQIKMNTATRSDGGIWGRYYIYNDIQVLIEKDSKERYWLSVEKVKEFSVSA